MSSTDGPFLHFDSRERSSLIMAKEPYECAVNIVLQAYDHGIDNRTQRQWLRVSKLKKPVGRGVVKGQNTVRGNTTISKAFEDGNIPTIIPDDAETVLDASSVSAM